MLKPPLTFYSKDIATHCDEQVKQKRMGKQFNFIRDRFAAKLNWRLKCHHPELLKEMKEVLSPMAQDVNRLQVEVRKCPQHVRILYQHVHCEGPKSAYVCTGQCLTFKPVLQRANQPLASSNVCSTQSMMGWQRPMSSPNDNPISVSLEHIFMGKCPLKLQLPRRTAQTHYCTWRRAKIFCLLIHWLIMSWW